MNIGDNRCSEIRVAVRSDMENRILGVIHSKFAPTVFYETQDELDDDMGKVAWGDIWNGVVSDLNQPA